ncbi:MAG: BBP7 family outer membrane beta-barrel protein, partial [Planctomycetota bacterium]
SADLTFAIDNDLDFESNQDGSAISPSPGDNLNGVPTVIRDDGDTSRALRLRNSNPNREGTARVTLGRFLFRDTSNRDHTSEFTFFGGGEFGQNAAILSDNQEVDAPVDDEFTSQAGRINVPSSVDQGSDVSFDGALMSTIQYDSRFNSLEWNYLVTSRMLRDRMELQPNGEWVRRANTGWTYHGLVGLRYFKLDENVSWGASSIQNAAINTGITFMDNAPDPGFTQTPDGNTSEGSYLVRTSNNMFGPQFGGGLTYESDRFNVTIGAKMSVLANDADSNSSLAFVDSATGAPIQGVGFTKNDDEPTLAFLGQFELMTRWHLRPHVSLRAGYEMMMLTAVALAPNQINFAPIDGTVVTSGDSFYHGISLGFEGYW